MVALLKLLARLLYALANSVALAAVVIILTASAAGEFADLAWLFLGPAMRASLVEWFLACVIVFTVLVGAIGKFARLVLSDLEVDFQTTVSDLAAMFRRVDKEEIPPDYRWA